MAHNHGGSRRDADLMSQMVDIQRRYWHFNAQEKEHLLARYPADLAWAETLRASSQAYDTDGSMTRFCCHLPVPNMKLPELGIGIGHQDLQVCGDQDSMLVVGIGSVLQLQTPLEMLQPDFDRRCRARGLDPDAIRAQHAP